MYPSMQPKYVWMHAFDEQPSSISFCLILALRSWGVSDGDGATVAGGPAELVTGPGCPSEHPATKATPAATAHATTVDRTAGHPLPDSPRISAPSDSRSVTSILMQAR